MNKVLFILFLLLISGFSSPVLAATSTPSTGAPTSQTVEATVREYFADIPVMVEIARCESKFRQFTDEGSVLRGGAGGQMVGVFQFFDRHHLEPAEDLGFDIETLDGNLAYARHVYMTQGINPWESARDCWDSATSVETADVAESDELLRQKIALLEQIIELLQTLILARQNTQ